MIVASCYGILAAFSILFYFGEALFHKSENYDEELTIKRLNSEQILSKFRFVITSGLELGPDYSLFPRIIAELTNKYGIEEFHFSLAQGFWHNAAWGVAPQPASPSGAELYAWFSGNETTVDERWNHFLNSLNGIFCTSMLEMIPSFTTSPRHLARFHNIPNNSVQNFLRYGVLASETVCTENLTPWKKLIPCKETGLSILLNPEKLYSAYYHSMSIHLTRICRDVLASCRDQSRLQLDLDLVTDIDLDSRSLDWSLYTLFERKVESKCMVARTSRILFERDRSAVSIENPSEKRKYQERVFYIYDIGKQPIDAFPINLRAHYRDKLDLKKKKTVSAISVHSFLGGTDQQSGSVITSIENVQAHPQKVVYTHVIPWFMQVYFHTVSFRCTPLLGNGKDVAVSGAAELLEFIAAKNREKPFLLQYELILPPKTECDFSFNFDKAFLRVTDFPPDANHGMYVPAAAITLLASEELWRSNRTMLGDGRFTTYEELNDLESSRTITLFAEVLLVSLPVPDFSMPFNVICFVSTAIAMLFGPVHSLTTKILIPVSESDKDLVPRPLLIALFVRFRELVTRFLSNYKAQKVEEIVDDTVGQPSETQSVTKAEDGW